MGKLIVQMHVSIDGMVGGPGGQAGFQDEGGDAARWIVESIRHAGVHIMGSRTFRTMAAHWPMSTERFAGPMNEIPKVVFSTSPSFDVAEAAGSTSVVSWKNARVARGDLAEEIRRLKAETGKPVLAHGGASFCQSLVSRYLVDELRLVVHPVAVGRGPALFAGLGRSLPLTLVSSTQFSSGVFANIYRPAS